PLRKGGPGGVGSTGEAAHEPISPHPASEPKGGLGGSLGSDEGVKSKAEQHESQLVSDGSHPQTDRANVPTDQPAGTARKGGPGRSPVSQISKPLPMNILITFRH